MLTPIAKLTTARQAVTLASETLECFGGAGYVEDTGLPRLLADSQVLPIWEGTTNVLSLDTLRALSTEGTFEALEEAVRGSCLAATDPSLATPAAQAITHLDQAKAWFGEHATDANLLEAGARRFAMALGHSFQLSCLCAHAQWALDNGKGGRAAAAARRFALDQQGGLGGNKGDWAATSRLGGNKRTGRTDWAATNGLGGNKQTGRADWAAASGLGGNTFNRSI